MPKIPIEQRFWAKVKKTKSCWFWTGGQGTPFHYGIISTERNRQPMLTHRLSYEIHNGPIPKGLCVLHICDIPICVNPNHLRLGTKSENSIDRHKKGRTAKGIQKPNSKFSNQQIIFIRKLCKKYGDQRKISKLFNVNPRTISDIINFKTWHHT